MASSFYPKLRLLAIVGGLALAACVLALMAAHKPAEATFPGSNGKIAFHSFHTSGEESGVISTITADGKVLKRLTNASYQDSSPAFSPDGSRIAFSSNRYKLRDVDIFTMNPNGSGVKNVTKTNALGQNDGFSAWSPDGRKVAFARGGDIFVRNADGTNEIQLTEVTEEFNFEPSWSPDGSKIVFSTRRCRDASLPCHLPELWVMSADGTDERRFLTDPNPDSCQRLHPDWSPDGTRVVFTSWCDGGGSGISDGSGIYVVNADGSSQKRLTTVDFLPLDQEPAWSPNGRKIAFIRAEGNVYDLFVMRADGTNITNYTNTPEAEEHNPSWQPKPAPAG
jgi:Tol biopolymer transport system component